MSLANAKPKLNYVPEYQASGVPFIRTAVAEETYGFKYVTSEVTVCTSGDVATIDFGHTGTEVFTIPADACVTFRVKAKTVHVVPSGTVSIVATLTNIESGNLSTYTDSDLGHTV